MVWQYALNIPSYQQAPRVLASEQIDTVVIQASVSICIMKSRFLNEERTEFRHDRFTVTPASTSRCTAEPARQGAKRLDCGVFGAAFAVP